jgi:type IV pilus assembly protein PilB
MVMMKRDLGELLVERRVITAEQLQKARQVQQSTRQSDLSRVLVDLGYVTEKVGLQAKAAVQGLSFVDLENFPVEASAVNVVSPHIARRHKVLPIQKRDSTLTVATSNPGDVFAQDDVRLASGLQVQWVVALPGAIEEGLSKHYGGSAGGQAITNVVPSAEGSENGVSLGGSEFMSMVNSVENRMTGSSEDSGDLSDEDLSRFAPIIRIAHTLLQQAVNNDASDIHLEPSVNNLRVRFRIDGVLHEVMKMPKHIHPPLISRFKIMSDMNIAERRVPQDGRIAISHAGKDFDLRVSCLPTLLGEKIVMRILDKNSVMIGLSKLGFFPDMLAQLESVITQPNGMILTTGPTGAGKTTTLYSVLNRINSVDVNILTVEDPVEYQLPGVSQVQVHRKAGLTFASALRSFLRQDPDIIMVGEIRDLETAELAIQASLTGHLVLSTLHTNDSPSAVTRLVDMGVEPFLISATLICAMAQRLGRRICQNCKEPFEVTARELRLLGLKEYDDDETIQLWKGRGCEACRQTGYKGRLGIYEIMLTNDEVLELISRRATVQEIKEAALANGMITLQMDGLRKVLEGLTTPDEVRRVIFTAGH